MSDDWDEEITGGFGGGGAIGRGFGRGRGGGGSDTNNNFGKKVGGFSGGDGPQMNGDVGGFGRKGFGGGAANDDSSTGGFGGGLGSRGGFGGGRGAASNRGGGFGAGRGDSVDSNGTGSFGSRGGGFGGKGRGGFGGGSSGGNEDTSNTRAGFGSQGGGGFGSKGGFGSNNDEPRGGGFRGGQSGGGFGGDKKPGSCFKCGEEGHMSRECPQGGSGGGGGGSRACFKCGEEGHMSRECPQGGGGGGGGGSRACFKCGEEGHMSRECPQGGGGGGGGGSRACFKCGEEGHMSRECPQGGGGGGGGGSRACFKCGEEGHMSRECPQGGGGGGGGGDKGCFKCKEEGHMARDCPNAESSDADKPREIYIPPPPPEDQESIFESIQKGINFDKYDNIGVECTGAGSIKTGLQSFTEANLYEKVQENIVKAKYDKPTPVQKFAIPVILNGHDLMACAQTGSGKTAAFLLPTLSKMIENGLEGSQFSEIQEPQAVVVGPTRELVTQIHREARKFSYNTMLRPVVVYGGTSVGHQLKSVEAGCHMVVGTPGRLMDFINRGKISLKKVKFLILDEADRMLDMGFEGEIRKLVEQLGMPPKTERQTLMFSATFPDQIQQLATDFLNNHVFITVGRVGGANTDVTQTIHEVTQYDKRDKLVAILNETGTDRTLVFVEQKRNADFLASYLSQNEFPTTSIHGDRLQREREEALRDFKLGKAPIMVATSVAARGLDIPGVKHVVNFDMPKDIDEYVHRIGRTGRCGNIGKATSFFDPMENKDLARPLVKILQDAQQEVPDWLEEAAQSSYGTGGFTNVGGRYGGRDARKGRSGGGGERSSGFDGNDGGGFGGSSGFGASSGGAAEEESWD